MDKRYYISRLSNGSNLFITEEKRDSKGDKYILIHMESGKSYKDFRYCFNSSSLKLLDKSGKENIDIKFFEVIIGMCIKTNSFSNYIK